MADEDRAQELELAEWESRNAARPPLPKYEPHEPGYGPELCVRCEDDMPAFRRRMGWRLCVACQSRKEAMA